jgi:glycerol-3-phosphate dehydrogenase
MARSASTPPTGCGCYIATKRLFEPDKCYFFQGTDGQTIFVIPDETDFTLIGTAEAEHASPGTKPACTNTEQKYLCAFASQYFKKLVGRADIVWTYSGAHTLYDVGEGTGGTATRLLQAKNRSQRGAPVLNVFGGEITTYCRLAESA